LPWVGAEPEEPELQAVTNPLGTARATTIPHSAARLLTGLSVFTTVPPWWWVFGVTPQHYANRSARVQRDAQCTATSQVSGEHDILTRKSDSNGRQPRSRRSLADSAGSWVESAPVQRAGDDTTGWGVDQ
jgi:hypothetical protein